MLEKSVSEKVLSLGERGPYAPNNCFHKVCNIIKLYEIGLENTTNLYDVCPLNQAKPGEWIGWGRGPINVPRRKR